MAIRYQQPQGTARIDWSHPLASHLVGAILPDVPVNLVDGSPLLYGTATGFGVGRAGKCLTAADGSQSGVYFTSPRLTSAMTLMTMVTTIELTATPSATRRQIMTIGDAWNAPYNAHRLEFSSDPQITIDDVLLYGQYPVPLNKVQTIGAAFRGAGGVTTWIDGRLDAAVSGTSATINTQGRAGWLNFAYNLVADRAAPVKGYVALFFDIGLSDSQLASITANPWQLFAPASRRLFAATAAGAPNHAASGALSAQAAVIAGAAAHAPAHSASGALIAQTAVIAGSAAHIAKHAASGALLAQVATIAGTAARSGSPGVHGATGALLAQSATVAGTAAHNASHAANGALLAQSATVAGTAAHAAKHAASGALLAQAAFVAGNAAHSVAVAHAASGALVAQAASISGGNRTLGSAPREGTKWPLVKKRPTQKPDHRRRLVDEFDNIADMFNEGHEGRLINPPPEVVPPDERIYSPFARQMRAKWPASQATPVEPGPAPSIPMTVADYRRKWLRK